MSNAYGQFWNRVHIPHIVSFGQNRDGSVFALDANGTCHPYDGSIESAIAEIRAVVGGAQPPFAWDVMGVTVTVDSIKGQFSFKWEGRPE